MKIVGKNPNGFNTFVDTVVDSSGNTDANKLVVTESDGKINPSLVHQTSLEFSTDTFYGDGFNTIFTASNAFISDSLGVYMNGMLLLLNDDYIVLNSTVTITQLQAPASTDKILLKYNKQ